MKGIDPHPLLGAFAPSNAEILHLLLHIRPAAEQRHIPQPTVQNISQNMILAYCRVFPPEDGDFRDPPVHLIVVSLLG